MKQLISVIVPVYNSEDYLDETIESVINQSIGFRKNIKIIFIDDGSKDSSADIIAKYKGMFPENIIYKKQKNSGVSVARNQGIKLANTQFIHFLDSDDSISKNFYKKSIEVFNKYGKEIDIVASRVRFFDVNYRRHYLYGNYKKTQLIDVTDKPRYSIIHLPATLLRSSSIGSLKLDDKLKITEDTKFLNSILIEKKKYGISGGSTYYYRKRGSANSAIDSKLNNRLYFTETPKRALKFLMDTWSTNGDPLPYIQHLLMNDIAWKIKEEQHQSVLSDKEEAVYKNSIYQLLERIDDRVIIENKILGIDEKIFILSKKYGEGYDSNITFRDGEYFFRGERYFRPGPNNYQSGLVIDFIHDLGEGAYKIEGFFSMEPISNKDVRGIKTSKGLFEAKTVSRPHRSKTFLGDKIIKNEAFEVIIRIEKNDTIEGYIQPLGSSEVVTAPIATKQFTGLGVLNKTYKKYGSTIFYREGPRLKALEDSKSNRLVRELWFEFNVLKNWQISRTTSWLKESIDTLPARWRLGSKKEALKEVVAPIALLLRSISVAWLDVFIRWLFFAGLFKAKRPIWLISDRGSAAGDNGEALFKYIMTEENPDADVYFVISRKSKDYDRIRGIGKVVDIDSFKYKMLFLRSSKVISSHADYYVYNSFGYRWTHLADLYNFDYTFLQHGITKDDMSEWLNRFEKNIKTFITAAKPEYESIKRYSYHYPDESIALTGFARFDLLESDTKNTLMLAPTWRHNLLKESRHHKSGIRQHSDSFKETEYFKFYNGLMNNEKILSAMRSVGMRGELYLHPAFSVQSSDFVENDVFSVKKMPYDYRKAFKESNILVTDYSSVAFDFAYLKKPVIYTHFDKQTLYLDHIYNEGYFSYEDDGFGPVVYDLDSAVQQIVDTIEGGFDKQKYTKRIEKFFSFTDRNNSKRIYKEIARN